MEKIIDTHIHLFDLNKFNYPWLDLFPQLKKNFLISDYFDTTKRFDIESIIFIEANVHETQLKEEIYYFTEICKKMSIPGGIICSIDIFNDNFYSSVEEIKKNPYIKGVRYVLHMDNIPPKTCLKKEFIERVQYLGEQNLIFEICARMNELDDIYKLVKASPNTKFILNHMGNIDPNLFSKKSKDSLKLIESWKKNMKDLASLENLYCKISGLYINQDIDINICKKIVEFCIDVFSEEKLIVGSNYPVSQEFFELNLWFDFLISLLDNYSKELKEKILFKNANKLYFNL